jgi:hypothetical protein
MEVCPLSREVCCYLYPFHYRIAFAFSILLYPLPLRLLLRVAFPEGEQRAYHVPHRYQNGLGLIYPPVAQHLR